jgi:uncharacterized membrane protein
MADHDPVPHDPNQSEWYAANLAAWFATRLEHDKSLLTLSAGGIGLLITLVSTVGIHSAESLILYILAFIAFVVCLAAVLWIFKRNSTHIEDVVTRRVRNDPWLTVLDNVAISAFLAGVILSCIIGVAAAVRSLEAKESPVPVEKIVVIANDSVNGLLNMSPDALRRSFNGVANMAPASIPSATPAAAGASAAQASAPTPSATPATESKSK